MLLLLASINFALATFDAWLTRKRILKYGPQVEGTEYMRTLATKMGPELGVMTGLLLPAALMTLILSALNWPSALVILVGYRLRTFTIQLQSLQFEKEARAIKDAINKRNSGS